MTIYKDTTIERLLNKYELELANANDSDLIDALTDTVADLKEWILTPNDSKRVGDYIKYLNDESDRMLWLIATRNYELTLEQANASNVMTFMRIDFRLMIIRESRDLILATLV